MGLVQIAFLGALGALAIPLAVHLMFRLRTRRVDLGTIRFLKEVLQKNARRKKMKRLILLGLRLACVALLAFLFARPYLLARGVGASERFVLVMVDRSASMQLENERGRLLDLAVAEAREVMEAAGKNTRVEAAFFDHQVRPLDVPGDLLDALQAPAATYGATDYGAALAWARDICVGAGFADKELHIFTDLQRSGLDWSDVVAMPSDVTVHLHELGAGAPNNVAVTAADFSRSLVRPGETANLAVTVLNDGPFDLKDVNVRLSLRNQRRTYNKQQQLQLPPGVAETFEFEVEDLQPGLWRGAVAVTADDELAFDNTRHVAIMAAPQWKVLVVDGQGHESPVLAETYFLESALRLAPPGEKYADTPYDPTVLEWSDDSGLGDLQDTDIVILANVPGLAADDVRRLAGFVGEGGGLVVFCGDNVQADSYQTLQSAGLLPGRIAGVRQASDLPWRIEEWDRGHSIFAPFNDPQHGDLTRLAFHGYTRLEPLENARVLATFRGGDPAIVERSHGAGSTLWFCSTCDRQWSDWPRSRLYLPLVHQMLGALTGLNEGGPVRMASIDASGGLDADAEPGVYQRQRHWQVINPSPGESETERCSTEEFVERFALRTDRGSEPTRVAALGPTTIEVRDDEVWHWVAFGLVGLLCVECLLANRTTA